MAAVRSYTPAEAAALSEVALKAVQSAEAAAAHLDAMLDVVGAARSQLPRGRVQLQPES